MNLLVESIFFTAILAVALLLDWRVRRVLGTPAPAAPARLERRAADALRRWTARVALPALVLLITFPAFDWAPRLFAPARAVDPAHVSAWVDFWLIVLTILAVEGLATQAYAFRGKPFPVPELLLVIVRNVILLFAAFAVLRYQLGVQITGLLASTALVTAVVGFALQGVLGNLLAGMSMHLVRSVVPSDWVAIGDREGEVIDMNWRETRLRSVAGHVIVLVFK